MQIHNSHEKLLNLYLILKKTKNWTSILLFRAGLIKTCRIIFKDNDYLDVGNHKLNWVVFLMIIRLKHNLDKFELEYINRNNLIITITKNSIKFLVNDITIRDTLIVIEEQFVQDLYRVKNFSLVGQTVVDVGANIGDSSILFASKGAKVFAFEPVPSTYANLVENIKVNNYSSMIYPYNVGLSDRNEEITVRINLYNSLSFSLSKNEFNINTNAEKIKLVETIGFLRQNNIIKCDILKIDCEGCEYVLLRDPSLLHYLNPTIVMIEYHAGNMDHLVDILKTFFAEVEVVPSRNHNQCGIIYAKC